MTATIALRPYRLELHRQTQRDGPRHPQVLQEDVGHAAPQRRPAFAPGCARPLEDASGFGHFDVDAVGAVAQYVKVNEYAWSVGNTVGNERSISIEMANATLAPAWTVAEATWKDAARLAGWLFAKVIGERPSKSNLFYHHHWSPTDARPAHGEVYDKVLAAAQEAYDHFKDAPVPGRIPSRSLVCRSSTPERSRRSSPRRTIGFAEGCNRYQSSCQ